MILKISIQGLELDGVPLEPERMKEPGYIQQQVNALKTRHAKILEKAFPAVALVYIDGVQSAMNRD